MKAAPIIALAPCALLLSCGEPEASKATHWRVSVKGNSSCLATLTQEMEQAQIDVAQFPRWKDGYGLMEFGPVSTANIENLTKIVRNSGCAAVEGKRLSCSTDYSDLHVC